MEGEARPRSSKDRINTDSISWGEVKAMFEAALTLQGTERELFLQGSCGKNLQLRQEVESLLESYDQTTGDFLDHPVAYVPSLFEKDLLPPPAEDIQSEKDTQDQQKQI